MTDDPRPEPVATPTTLTAERRLGGAGMRTTPAERREIALAYLTDPELGTISACAKYFKRTREAISACLKGEAFERLRKEVDLDAGEHAKRILTGAREQGARAWVQALDIAAEKGDHKPARDLLVATKVIEPAPATSNLFIGVSVRGSDGRQRWRDTVTGHVVDEPPSDAEQYIFVGGVDISDVKLLPTAGLSRDTPGE